MDKPPRLSLAATIGRLLTFRLGRDELLALDRRHLAIGLAATWLVGFGRTWDDPTVDLARRTGLGSVAYVFVLAAVLWLVLLPLRTPDTARVGYGRMLAFVALTAPPAALYAIPVERFVAMDTAIAANLAFLGVVATWRVALLAHFFTRAVGLRWFAVVVATLAPLALVVSALTFLNLAQGVIQIMGGLHERSPEDGVNDVLLLLTVVSYLLALPLLVAYVGLAFAAWRRRRAAAVGQR